VSKIGGECFTAQQYCSSRPENKLQSNSIPCINPMGLPPTLSLSVLRQYISPSPPQRQGVPLAPLSLPQVSTSCLPPRPPLSFSQLADLPPSPPPFTRTSHATEVRSGDGERSAVVRSSMVARPMRCGTQLPGGRNEKRRLAAATGKSARLQQGAPAIGQRATISTGRDMKWLHRQLGCSDRRIWGL